MLSPHHQLEDRSAAVINVSEFDSFLSSYQIDHLQFMQAQESHYKISADYLSSSSATVTEADRHALCSWSYEIIESLSNMNREISCIGMSYLDRFMATSSSRAKVALSSRHEYQLATVSCTVIAIKNRGGVKRYRRPASGCVLT